MLKSITPKWSSRKRQAVGMSYYVGADSLTQGLGVTGLRIFSAGIYEGIENLAVLENAAAHAALAGEARLFEDAHRSGIVCERFGIDSLKVESLESIARESRQGFGHNAAPPKWLPEPISDFRCLAMNVDAEPQSNASNRLRGCCYRKRSLGFLLRCVAEKRDCVLQRIGMGKDIAQINRDFPIVCMALQCGGVRGGPGSNEARLEHEMHPICDGTFVPEAEQACHCETVNPCATAVRRRRSARGRDPDRLKRNSERFGFDQAVTALPRTSP